MDDIKTGNFTDETDIDLNELFTIDFKNLKIFLTTILKNLNEMSQKIKDLEKKLKDQDNKNGKNISQIDKRVKIIEKITNDISNDKLYKENIPKEEKGKEKDDKKTKNEEKKQSFLTSNSELEIIKSKENKDKENDINNLKKEENINEKDENKNEKDESKTEKDENLNENKDDKDQNKEQKLDEEKSDNKEEKKIIIENDNNKNPLYNENKEINNMFTRNKSQRNKSKKDKEGENKNDTIPEEESGNGNENESEKEVSHHLNESQNDFNTSKYSGRRYEDPYRIPLRNNLMERIDDLATKHNLMSVDIEALKKRFDNLVKSNKTVERGSRFLSLKSLDTNPTEDLKFLKLQLKDMQNRNNDLDKENERIKKELEDIKVKIKDFDIYEIFKDIKLDQGSVDAAKALVMTLEQKVFKKTELIDEKLKRLEDGLNKMEVENKNTKNMAEILKLSSEDIRRMIKNLEELENKNAEDNLSILNDINDFKNEYKKNNINMEKKIGDINNTNNRLFEKIQQSLSDMELRLRETETIISKFDNLPKSNDDVVNSDHFKKLKNDFVEAVKELKRKDSDLERQIELLKLNSELKTVKEDISKIEKELSQKINNKEFLELKDKLSLQNLNINNLRDTVDRISELSNKAKNDMGFLLKRVEALSAAQVSTRTALDELIGKEQEFIFDSSKYLELTAFNKFIAGLQKEREKTDQNLTSIHKLLNEMAETIKTKSSSDDMKIFEDIIKNKLEELKLYSIKKFADKIENNKNIKFLDAQIRHIIDVYIKKLDKSDSWLIAKKPLGGFSCASCEAYLGELKKSQEYTPWNKYPNRERENNYRLGSGFSKMLNMLNVDFKNQIDAIKDNIYESDNEGVNSPEPKIHKRRLSKNLSSANINSTSINTNINNKNILPKINVNINKGENFTSSLSMDLDGAGIGTTNESGGANNESEGLKINLEHNEEQPHVVKVYRKNKINIGEMNKKI